MIRIIQAFLFSALLLGMSGMQSWAGSWDAQVEAYLGSAEKQKMEQEAHAAAAEGRVMVYWTAPEDEAGNPAERIYDGIPNGACFYSSQDPVWQPVVQQTVYPNSVHQVGGENGSVYVSWNNGRGILFPYTEECYQAIRAEVQAFRQNHTWAGMTDFEKEMQIIQYLVAHVSYPYRRYRSGQDTTDDHSVYGALVLGEAVCEGYAEAFCWLADACGLETRFLTGSYHGESHSWNMVKLEGHWYHVDLSADDPVVNGSSANGFGWGRLWNRYLNRTDAEFGKDHVWEPLSDAACVSEFYGPDAVTEYLH